MPDSRRRIFVSYRRKRISETDLLIASMRDRGLTPWRDVDDLLSEPTEQAIREALDNPNTVGAIIWLSPSVKDSAIIRDVEVPAAIRRRKKDSAFWVILVLAGGLDHGDVSGMFSASLGLEDLSTWNLTRVTDPHASPTEIATIANRALILRIGRMSSDASRTSLESRVHGKGIVSAMAEDGLSIDWTRHYVAGPPAPLAWVAMAEASNAIAGGLKSLTRPDLELQFSGTPSVAGAMLLGSSYSLRDGRVPTWIQRQPDGMSMTSWRASDAADSSVARASAWRADDSIYRSPDASALAVCVNVSDDVSEAFARSAVDLPAWRAILNIGSVAPRNTRAFPLSPEEVVSIAHLTIDAIRSARLAIIGIESIHFFIAGPAGLGFILGAMMATLPAITTYEFDTVSGRYVAAATFTN